ncbi:MAG: catalase [Candidatus Eutrophobiaceae bacterium]
MKHRAGIAIGILKRGGFALLVFLVVLGIWHWWNTRAPTLAVTMPVAQEELEQQRSRENFPKLQERYKSKQGIGRGAHTKSHACLQANFTVSEDLDGSLQHGVFAQPAHVYQAWMRLSNGHFDRSNSEDSQDDARGMAIKLLEPPGEFLEMASDGIPTQDFLLINSPVFFVRKIEDYNDLVAEPDKYIEWLFPELWNPFNWKIKEFLTVMRTMSPPPKHLLEVDYFSVTPYKLGAAQLNVKYGVKPCRSMQIDLAEEGIGADYLSEDLARRLEQDDACLRFMVQKQDISKHMPLDDPTVEWLEEDSPFIEVARLHIPSQDFNTPERKAFCENLSFSPWHTLSEHIPIGQFNRLRRTAYPASQHYRHQQNRAEGTTHE